MGSFIHSEIRDNSSLSLSVTHLHEDPDDDGNNHHHNEYAGIDACAENVADQFTTGKGHCHEDEAKSDEWFHNFWFMTKPFFPVISPASPFLSFRL